MNTNERAKLAKVAGALEGYAGPERHARLNGMPAYRLHDWAAQIREALAAPAEGGKGEAVCVWTEQHDGEAWDGGCGAVWQFMHGGPTDNAMHYCPQCGNRVEIDSPGGAKGITGSVSPQMRDANACTPQPAVGDGAVADALTAALAQQEPRHYGLADGEATSA